MKNTFCKRLRALRMATGLSQKEFAAIIRVTPGTLSNYENGIYLPPLETAYFIAMHLRCSLDYLTGLTNAGPGPYWLPDGSAHHSPYLKEPTVSLVAEDNPLLTDNPHKKGTL